ncbi:MAG: O-antigen ligase family protein [Flavobacteriaceae bacterium]
MKKNAVLTLSWIFVILISSVQFISNFGSIDRSSAQFLYLAIFVGLSTLYIFRNSILGKGFRIYSNELISLFFGFSFFALLSLLWAFNPTEGLINYFEVLLIGFCIYNISHHFITIKPSFKNISLLFAFLLVTDLTYILIQFVSIYDFGNPPGRTNDLLGFSSNLNVTGFNLLFRLPFVIFLIFSEKNKIKKSFLLTLFGLTLFFIISTGSRGAILAFILLFIIFTLFQLLYSKKNAKLQIFLLGFSILVFSVHSFLHKNGQTVVDRVETLSPSNINLDSSTNERLVWYNAAYQGILEKPLFGHGIGNWKIVGNKYVTQFIEQYIVPKHVHNDFVEVFAELGVIGGLLFVGFFVLLFIKVFRNKNSFENWKLEGALIVFSLLAYLLDSNLNFPFQRPISLINLSLIVGYIISVDEHNTITKKYTKAISFLSFIAIISITISTIKVHKGFVDEVEFLNRISNAKSFKDMSFEKLDMLNDNYPNINYATIPIVTYKGLFYWTKGDLEKAKLLLRKGNIINPFLFVAESNLATIYLEEGKIDSAYYNAKKAFYGLPNNERHTNIYQSTLAARGDLVELNKVFELVRHRKKEIIFKNHLAMTAAMKVYDSFNNTDREIAQQAVELFPDNLELKKYNRIITERPEAIDDANKNDNIARKFFNEKKYLKAIEKWELSKAALPTESAYYLNIAQVYSIKGDYRSSNAQLDSISILGINNHKGKYEYLRAMNHLLNDDKKSACNSLIISYRKGYVKEALPVLKRLKCLNK